MNGPQIARAARPSAAIVSRGVAPAFLDRLQRLAQDFSQQHQADQKLPQRQRESYTLLLAMRSWEFSAFTALRRRTP